jgi:hypothetical protein
MKSLRDHLFVPFVLIRKMMYLRIPISALEDIQVTSDESAY